MYTRICPKCGKEVTHKTKDSANHSKGKNCWECANRNNPEKAKKVSAANKGKTYNKSRLGKKATPEHRQKMSQALKGRVPGFGGKKHSEETRVEMSKTRAEMLRERYGTDVQISPFYNKQACLLFDHINEIMGWEGIHAENGGEVYVSGYWLDFYEPNLNLVIEYDEKRHDIPSIKEKDAIRQKKIESILKCKFIRIPESASSLDHIIPLLESI